MYAGDTFYTISAVGQGGLVVLSALLALTAILGVLALFRLTKSFGLRMTAAFAVFWIFLWVSPQIYYFFYQMVLSDLPWQIVIGGPPRPRGIVDLLLFSGPATIADHAKGVFGWTLLILGPAAKVVTSVRPPDREQMRR